YSAFVAAAIGVLWLAAVLLSRGARKAARPALPFVFRQGVANLYRPGNQTRSVILALGFGVFLMSMLYQVQRNLLRQLDRKLEQSRGNVVFLDVQQDQDDSVEALIRKSGYSITQRAPIVPMRISAINGIPLSALAKDTARKTRRSPWALRREFRSSYRAE